ncbi:MAG: phosphotransferase, partial [Chloroflexia bacterium]|nr:phosphotransferase [Chloroflexia bacterium]
MELYQISRGFARKTIDMRGDAGRAWIERLPALIAGCADRWSLTVHPPYDNLSYNYVVPVERADGAPAVLKLGFPADNELTTELAALDLVAGQGMVGLLEADPEQSVMLLERVEPGTPLTIMADDEAATRIAATVMARIWQPLAAPGRFPAIADWGQGFGRMRHRFAGGSGPIPPRLADRAEHLFAGLLASQAEPVLLHGDLHHDNILSRRDGVWLAIDPKGVTGEPAYEIGAFLRNPGWLAGHPDAANLTRRRIAIFTDML